MFILNTSVIFFLDKQTPLPFLTSYLDPKVLKTHTKVDGHTCTYMQNVGQTNNKYCKKVDQHTYRSTLSSYVVKSMRLSKYVYNNRQMKTQMYQSYRQLREQHVSKMLKELLIIF